jgi:hypothetical protein
VEPDPVLFPDVVFPLVLFPLLLFPDELDEELEDNEETDPLGITIEEGESVVP